jgi:hypothetical protein
MEGLEFIILFPCDLLVDPIFPFRCFSDLFWWIFVGEFWMCFFAGFVLGITHEVGVLLSW